MSKARNASPTVGQWRMSSPSRPRSCNRKRWPTSSPKSSRFAAAADSRSSRPKVSNARRVSGLLKLLSLTPALVNICCGETPSANKTSGIAPTGPIRTSPGCEAHRRPLAPSLIADFTISPSLPIQAIRHMKPSRLSPAAAIRPSNAILEVREKAVNKRAGFAK